LREGLTFITFTRNSGRRLALLLDHVKDIVDEIIVVDGYSSDDTVEIAKSFGAKVFQRKPWGYADPDRMFALKKASYRWVLYLDDDERLSRALKRDLRDLIKVAEEKGFSAIATPRINVNPRGKILLCPYYPDTQIRIFMRDKATYRGIVHELPEIMGPILDPNSIARNSIPYFIIHIPYQLGLDRKNVYKELIFYAKLEAMQKLSHGYKNPLMRALMGLAPITFPALYTYLVIKCILKERPIDLTSLLWTIDSAYYHSLVGFFISHRNKRWKKYAEIISKHGLIGLLGLDK